MSRHREPGVHLRRLVVRPWMWAVAALLWSLLAAAAAARELPALGIGACIGFAVVSAWAGGQLQGEDQMTTSSLTTEDAPHVPAPAGAAGTAGDRYRADVDPVSVPTPRTGGTTPGQPADQQQRDERD